MSDESVNLDDAQAGATYLVTGDDCCLKFSFTAVLMEKKYGEEAEPTLESVTFANGVRIDGSSFALTLAKQPAPTTEPERPAPSQQVG